MDTLIERTTFLLHKNQKLERETKMNETNNTEQKHARLFLREEVEIYDRILNTLEITVGDDYVLRYNDLPMRSGNKTLIRLCRETANYDMKKYVHFRPMKNSKQYYYILDYIHENEYEQAKVLITRNQPTEEGGKRTYNAKFVNGSEVLSFAKNCTVEGQAIFKALYIYLYGYSKKFERDFNRISDNITNYYSMRNKNKNRK